MSDLIGDATVRALQTALSRASRQTSVVASNLANLDTPGYRALEVRFDETFPSNVEVLRNDPAHLEGEAPDPSRGTVVEAPVARARNDGNTVDVDREMTRLAALQGRYGAAAKMVRKRLALLVYAATDGRSG